MAGKKKPVTRKLIKKKPAAKTARKSKPPSLIAVADEFLSGEPPGWRPGLYAKLIERARFVPDCGKKYTTNIYNRVFVRDCASLTLAEIFEMLDGLLIKAARSASTICSLNKKCPDPVLVLAEVKRDVCENRLWEMDVAFTFRCLKLV